MSDAVALRQGNGLDRPRFFDRQLLAAADLAIEQSFGDARLALFRANVIGWGVAAGLKLEIVAAAGDAGFMLNVGPGYALTPRGDEVYLPEQVTFADIGDLITAQCCCPTGDCTDVAPGPRAPTPYEIALAERRRQAERDRRIAGGESAAAVDADIARERAEEEAAAAITPPCGAWIIARPAPAAGGLAPAIPEGCGHPGNAMQAGRTCGGVLIEIACAIAPPHDAAALTRDALQMLICDAWGPPLEYCDAVANYVVLGRVEVADGVTASADDRRRIARLDRLSRLACLNDAPRARGTVAIDQPIAGETVELTPGSEPLRVTGAYSIANAVDHAVTVTGDHHTVTAVVNAAAGRWSADLPIATAGARALSVALTALPGGDVLATATRDVVIRARATGTISIARPINGASIAFVLSGATVTVDGSFSTSLVEPVSVQVSADGLAATALLTPGGWGTSVRFTTQGHKRIVARLVRVADGVELARATSDVELRFALFEPVPPVLVPELLHPILEVLQPLPVIEPPRPLPDDRMPIDDGLRDRLAVNEVVLVRERLSGAGVTTIGQLADLPAAGVATLLSISTERATELVDHARIRAGRAEIGRVR